ncbi:hypothetical protein JCM3770_004321, partial [Rhodotorula araucariae]
MIPSHAASPVGWTAASPGLVKSPTLIHDPFDVGVRNVNEMLRLRYRQVSLDLLNHSLANNTVAQLLDSTSTIATPSLSELCAVTDLNYVQLCDPSRVVNLTGFETAIVVQLVHLDEPPPTIPANQHMLHALPPVNPHLPTPPTPLTSRHRPLSIDFDAPAYTAALPTQHYGLPATLPSPAPALPLPTVPALTAPDTAPGEQKPMYDLYVPQGTWDRLVRLHSKVDSAKGDGTVWAFLSAGS